MKIVSVCESSTPSMLNDVWLSVAAKRALWPLMM
jgi:hypothetical protein